MGRRYSRRSRTSDLSLYDENYLHINLFMHFSAYEDYKKNEGVVKDRMWLCFKQEFGEYFDTHYHGDTGESTFERAWRGRRLVLHNRKSFKPLMLANESVLEQLFKVIQWEFLCKDVALPRRPIVDKQPHCTDATAFPHIQDSAA